MDNVTKPGKSTQDTYNRGVWLILLALLKNGVAECAPFEVNAFNIHNKFRCSLYFIKTIKSIWFQAKILLLKNIFSLQSILLYENCWSEISDLILKAKKSGLLRFKGLYQCTYTTVLTNAVNICWFWLLHLSFASFVHPITCFIEGHINLSIKGYRVPPMGVNIIE